MWTSEKAQASWRPHVSTLTRWRTSDLLRESHPNSDVHSTNGNHAEQQWTLQVPPALWDSGITEFIWRCAQRRPSQSWVLTASDAAPEAQGVLFTVSWSWRFPERDHGVSWCHIRANVWRELSVMVLRGAMPFSREHVLHTSSAHRVWHSYLSPEYFPSSLGLWHLEPDSSSKGGLV